MLAPTGVGLKPLCHLEIGNVPNIAAGYIRADAKKKRTIFNADRPCAEHRIGRAPSIASRRADERCSPLRVWD